MSPTNVTPLGGIGRPRTSVERRPFGPTIAEPADALRRSAVLGATAPEPAAAGDEDGGTR